MSQASEDYRGGTNQYSGHQPGYAIREILRGRHVNSFELRKIRQHDNHSFTSGLEIIKRPTDYTTGGRMRSKEKGREEMKSIACDPVDKTIGSRRRPGPTRDPITLLLCVLENLFPGGVCSSS